ncbi:hypothetical protein [Micromonospora sp. NPDC005806]|uniref:hypothetical protein n=1 Tax=Micromonospora sp. NPDC005806 TaxID=3364234 RepID=UPI0036C3866C
MWLASGQIIRAAGGDVSGLTVAVGALAVLASIITALLGLRGTLRTSDTQREANFDKRVDERLANLEKRCTELETELRRYQEMYARLRLDVFAAGLDPDKLGRRSTGEPSQ